MEINGNHNCIEGLQEFVMYREVPASQLTIESPTTPVLNEVTTNGPSWTRRSTLKLIDAYRHNRDLLGKTIELKTKKKLWDLIVNIVGDGFTASQCENRWKTLERGFKKYVDNKNNTGTGRKEFEYFNEMDEIFGRKRNVHPILLLNSNTVSTPQVIHRPQADDGTLPTAPSPDDDVSMVLEGENVRLLLKAKRKVRHRSTVFDEYRQYRKQQHDEMMQMYRERLAVEKQRVAEMRLRNQVLLARNEILKEKELRCYCKHE